MVTRAAYMRGMLAVALVLGLAWPGAAQEDRVGVGEDVRFARLDGLSHNTVLSIVQDRDGYLWIGTPDGLNRYDGYTFTVYRHRPGDTTSLSNNFVRTLLVDRAGMLWVGTDRGLDRFDRATEHFTRFQLGPDTLAPHRRGVLRVLEDERGDLWIATTASGLYQRDVDTGTFIAYRHDPTDPHSLADDEVWSTYRDRRGTVWITTREALHRYAPEKDRFQRFAWPFVAESLPPSLVYGTEGHLWISGPDWTGQFSVATQQFEALPLWPPDTFISSVMAGPDGSLWVGSSESLYRLDPATGQRTPVPTDPASGAYLQNRVRTLYADRAGTLWVGTLSGLYRFDAHVKPFRHLGRDAADPSTRRTNTVMAVLESHDETLWIGTLGGGLNRVDPRTGDITHYEHRAGDADGLCHDLIWSLHEDRQGDLWIGTDQGLCWMDPATERFARLDLPLGGTTPQPAINDLHQDRQGTLWVASYAGLYSHDPKTGTTTRWHLEPAGPGPAFQSVQSLYEDRDGALWIGLFGGLLYRLAPGTRTPTRFPILTSEGQELVGEGIWAIHQDRDGLFWFGSDQGLTRFDARTGRTRQFTQQDGLPGSAVYAILEDDEHRLWLSTNHGLVRVDSLPSAPHFRTFDTGDGLVNVEFNRRAAFRSARGELFFGGLQGLTTFFPDQIRDNPFVPPVVLTAIETSSRDTTITHNPAGRDRLVLSYRAYAITFEFAALNFTNPSQNRYAYRLEGFDEHWVEAGTRRFAHYTNLPPGDYTFRVKGSNDDGVWNEAGASLRLTVTPPFWQRWWFRVLVLAGVVGVLAAAYRYRVARLIEMERMRLRIAGDLHDDIGSNLSSIALLSDMVQERAALDARARRHLVKISHSARSMVEALRDIVWSIDPDADRADELVQRMRDTAAALLGSTPYMIHASAHDLPDLLDMNLRRHLFLGYKEMLHNVARHADADAVTIRLVQRDGHLVLAVTDDGTGFDAATAAPGSGLKHLRERADRLGGTLEVDSRPGQGTTVRLIAPLHARQAP